ncbi:hypothetical protein ACO0OL_002070 [Hanseniaspora opuntiae]
MLMLGVCKADDKVEVLELTTKEIIVDWVLVYTDTVLEDALPLASLVEVKTIEVVVGIVSEVKKVTLEVTKEVDELVGADLVETKELAGVDGTYSEVVETEALDGVTKVVETETLDGVTEVVETEALDGVTEVVETEALDGVTKVVETEALEEITEEALVAGLYSEVVTTEALDGVAEEVRTEELKELAEEVITETLKELTEELDGVADEAKTETLDEIAGVEMIVIKVLVAGVILEESWEYDPKEDLDVEVR